MNQRLEKIADFVSENQKRTYLGRADRARLDHYLADYEYRWRHTLRVANYGKKIAEAEGADVELTVAACLLHDVAWFEPGNDRDHGRVGAKLSRPFLEQLGYPSNQVENICFSVAVHVDGKAGYEFPETLESKIVSDADNIDRFGAYRILQRCLLEIGDFNQLANGLRDRLEVLRNYRGNNPLETETGRKIFQDQLDLQIDFFEKISAEQAISVLPSL